MKPDRAYRCVGLDLLVLGLGRGGVRFRQVTPRDRQRPHGPAGSEAACLPLPLPLALDSTR
jgi:hypothetical protein